MTNSLCSFSNKYIKTIKTPWKKESHIMAFSSYDQFPNMKKIKMLPARQVLFNFDARIFSFYHLGLMELKP